MTCITKAHLRAPALIVVTLLTLISPDANSRQATAPAARAGTPRWIAAWAASPQGPYATGYTVNEPSLAAALAFGGTAAHQTVRLIVHTAAAGDRVRVRLSNTFGAQPLTFGAASLARRATGATLSPGSVRRLTFGGRSIVTIPPGREMYSDPVRLTVSAQQDLAVSLYVPGLSGPAMTWHGSAFTTSYLSKPLAGDHSADQGAAAFPYTTTSWFWLDGVDVATTAYAGVVVALGDSLTDGVLSSIDGNNRWPDVLARRLLRLPVGRRESVVDAGISGNTVSAIPCGPCGPASVERLDRDVLGQAGVRQVILFQGGQDIGRGASAAHIIAAMRDIARRVHARGLAIDGATITPDGGTTFFTTPAICLCMPAQREAVRQAVNAFVRKSGVFDAVIDFDALLRDPRRPDHLNARYDSGDHLHPNVAGLQAMGDAIPLSIFAGSTGGASQ